MKHNLHSSKNFHPSCWQHFQFSANITDSSFSQLFVADKMFGLRVSPQEEMLGADYCTHGIPLRFQPEEEKPRSMRLSKISKKSNATKKNKSISASHMPDILEDISTSERSAQNFDQ